MSLGTPIVSVRIPRDMMLRIQGAIASANLTRREEEYTVSSWILSAIDAKLAHLARGKYKSVRDYPCGPAVVPPSCEKALNQMEESQ